MSLLMAVLVAGPVAGRAQEAIRLQNGAVLTVGSGAVLTMNGGITLDNGSRLNHSGTITVKSYGVSGTGDWTDNTVTPYTYGSGTTVFNGAAMQTVKNPNSFGAVTIESTDVNLDGNMTAATWLLKSGVVTTNGFKAVATSTTTTAIQPDPANPGYSASYFDGTFSRYIAPSTVDSYDFPVGSGGQTNLVTLANLTANPLTGTQWLDVYFGPKPGTDAGLVLTEGGTPYTSVNGAGVWHITPDAEPTGGQYDLLLYLNGFTGLADNEFALLERPDISSNAADWMVPPGSSLPAEGAAGRTVASGYARRNGLSAFSQFGIGMTSTPLPVTLLSFTASRIGKKFVDLDWQTATEDNDKGFGVERRLDDESAFSDIGFVPSLAPGGTSASPLAYSYTDTNSYSGISYYRLKQEDLDDRFVYTVIKAVSGSGNSGVVVSLYPNPGHGQFTLRVDGTGQAYTATITDIPGHTLRRIEAVGNNNVSVSGLPPGFYIVRIPNIFGNGQSFVEKVLIVP
jgi:Secretion system C-terminal sorting domain